MVNQKGTYALILEIGAEKSIQVGRLGKRLIEAGFYIYVGSAFGPGGLKARLNHHLKSAPNPHWHIDYLRRYARIIEIWYTTDPVRREQDWVVSMEKLPATLMVHPGFGASDSKDISHLFLAPGRPKYDFFVNVVDGIPNHGNLFVKKLK